MCCKCCFDAFCYGGETPSGASCHHLLLGVTNMVMDAVLVLLLPQAYKLAGAAIATGLSQLAVD